MRGRAASNLHKCTLLSLGTQATYTTHTQWRLRMRPERPAGWRTWSAWLPCSSRRQPGSNPLSTASELPLLINDKWRCTCGSRAPIILFLKRPPRRICLSIITHPISYIPAICTARHSPLTVIPRLKPLCPSTIQSTLGTTLPLVTLSVVTRTKTRSASLRAASPETARSQRIGRW